MNKINRSFLSPKESFFLFGPRGTGKSTYLRDTFPNAKLIDFLDPETYRNFIGKPEILKEIVEGNSNKKIFILDEIQKIPEVLSVIHQLIEANKKVQFILTGSSYRKLKRTGVDLLAGRAVMLVPVIGIVVIPIRETAIPSIVVPRNQYNYIFIC
jgi:predicted AAA+ superfamily ATPase